MSVQCTLYQLRVCVAILSAQLARYVDSSGVHRVQGGPNLKATQYYPRLFGHTVAQLWEQHHGDIKLAIKNKMPLICARGANKGEMAYLYYNLLESMVALYGKMCFRRFTNMYRPTYLPTLSHLR